MGKEQDLEYKNGQTDRNTLEIGLMIKQMVMELYIMQMEIYMKESGKTIKRTDLGNTHMRMEPNTQEIGEMINNMDKEKNNGQMVHVMKVNTMKEERMGKEN